MKRCLLFSAVSLFLIISSVMLTGCQPTSTSTIVVTHSILGAVVKELVGESVTVTVLMPEGADPHDWEPSARDIEKLNKATLIIWNGLHLEVSIESAVTSASGRGVSLFTATDHIQVRFVGEAELTGDEHATGAADPHFWLDPLSMKSVITALAAEVKAVLGIDTAAAARNLESRLDDLHAEMESLISGIPSADRKLVTGHDSMGYFARRYGFDIIGSVVPNLSSQAAISASDIAALVDQIKIYDVKAIFTEAGASTNVVQQISAATGIKVVELAPTRLPPDGSYFTFMSNLTRKVVGGLQ
ncbi:MAG: metal ABC transporter substrate-binding protein [Dehalogenimonas sp.]